MTATGITTIIIAVPIIMIATIILIEAVTGMTTETTIATATGAAMIITIATEMRAGGTITGMKTAIGGTEQKMKLLPGLAMMMQNDAVTVMKEREAHIVAKAQKITRVPRKESKKMCLTN